MNYELIAYRIPTFYVPKIIPAERRREWMDQTNEKFANRCLPLLIANQNGWFVLNNERVEITWDGGLTKQSLTIVGLGPGNPISHFGHGILTFNIPFIFRTPRGFNLRVEGPVNAPKDAVVPLTGVVETDWAWSTFTMNWKMTRTNTSVVFEEGEPICMVTPQRRGETESFDPIIRDIESDPELHQKYREWSSSRNDFNSALNERRQTGWQKDYFLGKEFDSHQTNLKVKQFRNE